MDVLPAPDGAAMIIILSDGFDIGRSSKSEDQYRFFLKLPPGRFGRPLPWGLYLPLPFP